MMQCQNVHCERDCAMQKQAEPDVFVSETQPTEKNSRQDCGESFGGRFAEMNHTIRHGHHKYRINSESRFQTLHQKTAKEKFKSEKLQKINRFPDEKIASEIRFAVKDSEKRIFFGKSGGQRHCVNQRQHKRRAKQINFSEAFFEVKTQTVIGQIFAPREFNYQSRNNKIKQNDNADPICQNR